MYKYLVSASIDVLFIAKTHLSYQIQIYRFIAISFDLKVYNILSN